LDEGFRSQLDVEEVCRAFLDLAKAWSRRLIDIMYSDAGGFVRCLVGLQKRCFWSLMCQGVFAVGAGG
jgi:hypothetical protein